MATENDRQSRDTDPSRGRTAPKGDAIGPVPMRHRLRLGQTDGQTNAQYEGNPSHTSTVRNTNGKGW